MKRSAPMKRTGFKPKAPPPRPAKQVDYTPTPRPVAVARVDQSARLVVSHPKWEPVRHKGYRMLVAGLPCMHCHIKGLSQAAHPNTGKGAWLKTDDRECFPLCADSPGRSGCHPVFDQGALFSKPVRRSMESLWGVLTRQRIKRMGLWPADLAPWPEDEEVTA